VESQKRAFPSLRFDPPPPLSVSQEKAAKKAADKEAQLAAGALTPEEVRQREK
jgi:hypothetical protein